MMPKLDRTYRSNFSHWGLEVYRVAVGFFRDAYVLAEKFRRDDAFMRWQFLRAALSIMLNIAEGCAETAPLEKARIYRIARRSAQECAALLDAAIAALDWKPQELEGYYKTIARIMAMLLQLIRKMENTADPKTPRSTPGVWSKRTLTDNSARRRPGRPVGKAAPEP
jgi:four helix bundle protein